MKDRPGHDFRYALNSKKILNELSPKSNVVSIPNHKKGPIYTVMPFIDTVDDEEEVIVCYCDNPLIWDKYVFFDYVHKLKEYNNELTTEDFYVGTPTVQQFLQKINHKQELIGPTDYYLTYEYREMMVDEKRRMVQGQ